MAEIHYSPIALNDLDEIWAYISLTCWQSNLKLVRRFIFFLD